MKTKTKSDEVELKRRGKKRDKVKFDEEKSRKDWEAWEETKKKIRQHTDLIYGAFGVSQLLGTEFS